MAGAGERTLFFSCGKVPSDKKSQSTCKQENYVCYFPHLDGCFRVMLFLEVATGLRRRELLALKWEDIDFNCLQINVRRSIYLNVIGNCKTEASRNLYAISSPMRVDADAGQGCFSLPDWQWAIGAESYGWARCSSPAPAHSRRRETPSGTTLVSDHGKPAAFNGSCSRRLANCASFLDTKRILQAAEILALSAPRGDSNGQPLRRRPGGLG